MIFMYKQFFNLPEGKENVIEEKFTDLKDLIVHLFVQSLSHKYELDISPYYYSYGKCFIFFNDTNFELNSFDSIIQLIKQSALIDDLSLKDENVERIIQECWSKAVSAKKESIQKEKLHINTVYNALISIDINPTRDYLTSELIERRFMSVIESLEMDENDESFNKKRVMSTVMRSIIFLRSFTDEELVQLNIKIGPSVFKTIPFWYSFHSVAQAYSGYLEYIGFSSKEKPSFYDIQKRVNELMFYYEKKNNSIFSKGKYIVNLRDTKSAYCFFRAYKNTLSLFHYTVLDNSKP